MLLQQVHVCKIFSSNSELYIVREQWDFILKGALFYLTSVNNLHSSEAAFK